LDHNGVKHNGGQLCKDALGHLVNGKKVRCRVHKRYGAYGRMYARCCVSGEDVGKWIVRHGYAVAVPLYGRWYVRDERYARRKSNGLWRGTFDWPTDWASTQRRKRLVEIYRKKNLIGNPDEMSLEDLMDGLKLAWRLGRLTDPMSYFTELELLELGDWLSLDSTGIA
jgi:hypothetical protein